ncbi:thioredoxin family protein [Thiobacter aerophilum]|uniref:Thioredoxin family protein n=1 Tax=Thiobacter aerophilum TaxID=3121275 RepID=A0ABV0EER3_9BURK
MLRALFFAGLMLVSFATLAEKRDVNQYFFDQKLGDFKAELATARAEGKKGILLMFEQEDCPWCHRMKETILNQSEVQDYFKKHFLIYSIDIKNELAMVDFKGKQTTEKAFAAENRVRATPVFLFFDLDGNPMYRFTGVAKDPKEFLLLGRYVVEGLYKTTPFNVYKTQAAAQ